MFISGKILTCRYYRRRRRFHRWSHISRLTASSTLSSPVVTSSRHSKRSIKATSPTPEASPMLPNSADTSPAHQATSTSGLLRRQQNGNLFDFKPDSNSTEKRYGTTNGIRAVDRVTSIDECKNMLNRTNSSSSSSSSCSASSSGSSSSQGLYKCVIDNDIVNIRNSHAQIPKAIYKNVTEIKDLKRTTSRTSDTCSCNLNRQNLSRKSSSSSKTSLSRKESNLSTETSVPTMTSENNNNEQFNKTNGALIRDITPPDLVAEIMDIIASGSDKTPDHEEDKEHKEDVQCLPKGEDVDDSIETSV